MPEFISADSMKHSLKRPCPTSTFCALTMSVNHATDWTPWSYLTWWIFPLTYMNRAQEQLLINRASQREGWLGVILRVWLEWFGEAWVNPAPSLCPHQDACGWFCLGRQAGVGWGGMTGGIHLYIASAPELVHHPPAFPAACFLIARPSHLKQQPSMPWAQIMLLNIHAPSVCVYGESRKLLSRLVSLIIISWGQWSDRVPAVNYCYPYTHYFCWVVRRAI